jgi:Lrp/AsnC family leucine-responsive transcriptional regulator
MKKNRFNNRILQELTHNARTSNLDLADHVGLSPSACLRRVQELERSGVIKNYRAVFDQTALGREFTAYVPIGLSDHSKKSQESFERAIQDAPDVRERHNITGTFEYLLRVEVADLVAYKAFHSKVLGGLPQVNTITSYVVIDSPKDERG